MNDPPLYNGVKSVAFLYHLALLYGAVMVCGVHTQTVSTVSVGFAGISRWMILVKKVSSHVNCSPGASVHAFMSLIPTADKSTFGT